MGKKLKPILPSLREKKRYLAFEVLSKDKMEFNEVANAVWGSSLQFMGQLGTAKAGIWLLPDKWNQSIKRGLIKVNHKHVDNLRAALTLIDDIKGEDVIVRSVGISGILNKAEKRYLTA